MKFTDSSFRGRAFSLNQSTTQLGTMSGPIIGGLLGGWIGIPLVYAVNGLALIGVGFSTNFAVPKWLLHRSKVSLICWLLCQSLASKALDVLRGYLDDEEHKLTAAIGILRYLKP